VAYIMTVARASVHWGRLLAGKQVSLEKDQPNETARRRSDRW
jgi:hypothetical protein